MYFAQGRTVNQCKSHENEEQMQAMTMTPCPIHCFTIPFTQTDALQLILFSFLHDPRFSPEKFT